ncbi:MAG: universal stress protein [Haloferacaceae archaeon]
MSDVRHVAGDDGPEPGYAVVVAVANPDSVEQLMRTAIDLASDRDGRIRAVSVVHKPVTSPFLLFSDERIKREFATDRTAVLDRAVAAAEGAGVPVDRSLLVGSDVAGAVRSAIEAADADAAVIGWRERSRPADVVLGTTVDPLLRRAPCDVFVERIGRTADGLDAVLLPTDGGPHVAPAADLAGAVARANAARVTVVSYVSPAAGADARDRAADLVAAAAGRLSGVTAETDVREADAVGEAIASAADDHDLVVLGATREGGLRTRVVGSVARTVGRRAAPPVVIARRGSDASLVDRALDRLR